MSLVLVWPSTQMQLKLRSAAAFSDVVQVGLAHRGVGQDEAEHGRHVRADHRRPLGEPGDA